MPQAVRPSPSLSACCRLCRALHGLVPLALFSPACRALLDSMTLSKSPSEAAITVLILIAAAICEVSGGWCIWKWRREGWHWWLMIVGAIVVIASGIVPTLQKEQFNRTYALYGGFFICASFLWGWALDKKQPDLWDAIGSFITLGGVLIVVFVPRRETSDS